MDIILVPGLWLDASSWNAVLPALEADGHRPIPLTMPGVGQPAEASADIGIADWVAAVVAQIDTADQPVALVGHSGGGNVVWGAADSRPEQVACVITVDTLPPPPGYAISEFEVVDGVVPFPGWDFFEADDVADIPAAKKELTSRTALSVPAKVPSDAIELTDVRRYHVPVTVLSGRSEADQLRAELMEWPDYAQEIDAIESFDVVRIGSGHWPQFSTPDRLAELILAAVSSR